MSIILGVTDIETTGLSQEKGHRIIEICLAMYRTDDWREFKKIGNPWTKRIDPERSIDPAAQHVHGISIEDLKGCEKWEEVSKDFHKLLSACDLVVAHNGDGFDLPFIGLEFLRIGMPIPNFKTFDTMLRGRGCTPMGNVPNLGKLCWAMGVHYDPSEAHAADYDVEKTAESFFEGCRRGWFTPQDAFAEEKACA